MAITTTDKWDKIMENEFSPATGADFKKYMDSEFEAANGLDSEYFAAAGKDIRGVCGLPPTPLAFVTFSSSFPYLPKPDVAAYNDARAKYVACKSGVVNANLANYQAGAGAGGTPDPNAGNPPPAPPVDNTTKTASSTGMSTTMKLALVGGGLVLITLVIFAVKSGKKKQLPISVPAAKPSIATPKPVIAAK